MGDGLVDHLVDVVVHVPGIGRVGLDLGDAGLGKPADLADVVVPETVGPTNVLTIGG